MMAVLFLLPALGFGEEARHIPYYACSQTLRKVDGGCAPSAKTLAVKKNAAAKEICDVIDADMRNAVTDWTEEACEAYVTAFMTITKTGDEADDPLEEMQRDLAKLAAEARVASGEAWDGGVWDDVAKRECLSDIMHVVMPGRIAEVGFNSGQSAAMFLHNNNTKVTSFDLCAHTYWRACYDKLRSAYGEDRVEIVCGDSATTVAAFPTPTEPFEAVFVDGSHLYAHVRDDLRNLKRLSSARAIVVADDCHNDHVELAWEHAVASGLIASTGLCRHVGLCVGSYTF